MKIFDHRRSSNIFSGNLSPQIVDQYIYSCIFYIRAMPGIGWSNRRCLKLTTQFCVAQSLEQELRGLIIRYFDFRKTLEFSKVLFIYNNRFDPTHSRILSVWTLNQNCLLILKCPQHNSVLILSHLIGCIKYPYVLNLYLR